MATYSRILAWKIPWTEKPGGLQSMDSQRVGDSLSSLHFAYEKMSLFFFSDPTEDQKRIDNTVDVKTVRYL